MEEVTDTQVYVEDCGGVLAFRGVTCEEVEEVEEGDTVKEGCQETH